MTAIYLPHPESFSNLAGVFKSMLELAAYTGRPMDMKIVEDCLELMAPRYFGRVRGQAPLVLARYSIVHKGRDSEPLAFHQGINRYALTAVFRENKDVTHSLHGTLEVIRVTPDAGVVVKIFNFGGKKIPIETDGKGGYSHRENPFFREVINSLHPDTPVDPPPDVSWWQRTMRKLKGDN